MALFQNIDALSGLWLIGFVSAKVVLLSVLIFLGARFYRTRSSELLHRAATCLLIAMLLMPVLVFLVPNVLVWKIESTSANQSFDLAETKQTLSEASTADSTGDSPKEVLLVGPVLPQQPSGATEPTNEDAALRSSTENVSQQVQPRLQANPQSVSVILPASGWTKLAFCCLAVYLAVVLILLVRLSLGLFRGWRLTRTAKLVELPDSVTNSTLVVESDRVSVPVTLGFWNPRIVLPSDWNQWNEEILAMVIAHEACHVNRGDTRVMLLSAINCAFYWFHPLSWWLGRQISELAEHVCDDMVIKSTGRPLEYASCLIEMASRLNRPVTSCPVSVGMARTPMVVQRVDRIIKSDGSSGKQPGRMAAILTVLLVGLTAVFSAAVGGVVQDSEATSFDSAQEGVIKGRVVGTNGLPVAGARVFLTTTAFDKTAHKKLETETSEYGEFSFTGISEGNHRLAAFHEKQALRKGPGSGLIIKPGGEPVTLQLHQAPSLVVKFISKDGKPIKNGSVIFRSLDNGQKDFHAGANGEVRINQLARGSWRIKTKAPGYSQRDQVVVVQENGITNLTVRLEPGADLHGTVRDENGNPISKAVVYVSTRQEQHIADFYEFVEADANGEYEVTSLPVNQKLSLEAFREDKFKRMETNVSLQVAPGQRHQLDLKLTEHPQFTLNGIVVDEDGNPIKDSHLKVRWRFEDPPETTADVNGRFAIEGVRPDIRLDVKAAGFVSRSIETSEDMKRDDFQVTLEKSVVVTGTVVDEEGEPLSGVRIPSMSIEGYSPWGVFEDAISDTNGKFRLERMPAKQNIDFRKSGYHETSIDLTADDATGPNGAVDLGAVRLAVASSVCGNVVDEATGEPIKSFRMEFGHTSEKLPGDPSGKLGGGYTPGGKIYSSDGGKFVVKGLLKGMPIQVAIQAEGYQKLVRARVVARSDSKINPDEFRLVKLGAKNQFSMMGKIKNSNGEPVVNVDVGLIVTNDRNRQQFDNGRNQYPFNWKMIQSGEVAQDFRTAQFLTTTTDEGGGFSFSGVQIAKDIELVYWGDKVVRGRMPGVEAMSLRERNTIKVAVIESGGISGAIDVIAFPDASLTMETESQGHYDADISRDGKSYEIPSVPPGEHALLIYGERKQDIDQSSSTSVVKRITVMVKAGKTVLVDVVPDRYEEKD